MSPVILWLALSSAHAASWADFAAAFPSFPCSDGWMGCVVQDAAVSPELERDASGMPAPADLRVGWFDLEPRATFSPFAGLSAYAPPGAPKAEVVAVVAAPEVPVVAPSDRSERPEPRTVEPPKQAAQGTQQAEQKATVTPEEPVVEVAREEVAPRIEAVDDAAVCGDLHALEMKAMLGNLADDQVACLGRAYDAAAKITDRDKISRVVMADAYGKGDLVGWDRLISRHLRDIDQSDPDLAYKYAQYLAKSLPARAPGVIRWTEVALERRSVWTGDTYTQRVGSLYKLRTQAAQSLWIAAEAEHAKAPTDATKQKVEETRSAVKVSAREWYEYQVVAKKDATVALQVCTSAAGTSDYCESR